MASDELLRQILADPTDAPLRMVYADQLMAAGDPRGELIAVEEALEGELPPAQRLAHQIRRTELRAHHGATWWPELPVHRIRTRRGFAVAINARADALPARLLDTELVEELELDLVRGDAAFDPAPWQARLRRLAIRGGRLRAEALAALCSSPLGAQLESFDGTNALWVAPLGDGLPRCRRLVVAHNGIMGRFSTLLRWRHLAQLEELDARSCLLDAAALDDLLALDLAGLRVLKLSCNQLGEAGTHVLQRRLRGLPRLERLELVDCDVTDITHAAITEREDLPPVIELCGATLELVRTAPGRYGLLVDGVRRRLRHRATRRYEGGAAAPAGDWTEGDDAPLEPLYQTIAGCPLVAHTPVGARIRLSFELVDEYAQHSITETLDIALGDPIELQFESDYVTAP